MATPISLTIDMPLHRAKRAAQAVLPHISTDDVTPVLTAAFFTDGHLVATDRYSVGRIRLASPEARPDRPEKVEEWENNHEVRYYADGSRTEEAPEFMVPRTLISRMAGLHAGLLPLSGSHNLLPARVRVEVYEPKVVEDREGNPILRGWDWADLALFDGERAVFRQSFLNISGNFPPVGRLMDEWVPAEEPGSLNFTPANLKKVTQFADRYDIIRLEGGKPGVHKLAPTRLTIADDFTALLQPNLDLR